MIDISNLSPEKRAFLKVNPEFLKSLEAEIPRQAEPIHKRKLKENRGKAKWQREDLTARADEIRRRADKFRREHFMHLPLSLRELNRELMEKDLIIGEKQLVCPGCGAVDKRNRMNGRPWCFKCKLPLIPKRKVKRWLKLNRINVSHKKVKDEFKKRGLDF